MSMNAARLLFLGACVVSCAVAIGCGDDGGGDDDGDGGGAGSDDDGGATTSTTGAGGAETFSCLIAPAGSEYSTCIEYKGSASYIATIREGTNCAGQGGVEGTGCSPAGAARCVLGQNGMTGTSGTTYYYGLTADDVESYQAICEQQGGTFTPPG